MFKKKTFSIMVLAYTGLNSFNIIWNVCLFVRTRCTTLCDKVCQWIATGRWFSPGPPVSFTNKTDHDITDTLFHSLQNLQQKLHCLLVCLKVFNATFNNVSVISWSVLLVKEVYFVIDLFRQLTECIYIVKKNIILT
jgi:hypothetical protein